MSRRTVRSAVTARRTRWAAPVLLLLAAGAVAAVVVRRRPGGSAAPDSSSGGQVSEISAFPDRRDATIFPSDATAGYPLGDGDERTQLAGEGTRPNEGEAGPNAIPGRHAAARDLPTPDGADHG